MLKLSNSFHGSFVNLRPRKEAGRTLLSEGQVKRAKRELCGLSGCVCSGDLGTRGPQEAQVEIFYDSNGKITGAEVFYDPV